MCVLYTRRLGGLPDSSPSLYMLLSCKTCARGVVTPQKKLLLTGWGKRYTLALLGR